MNKEQNMNPTELTDVLNRYRRLLHSSCANEEMKTWFKKWKACSIGIEEFKNLIEKAEKLS